MNVRLRAMEPEDLDLLYQLENDQDLWKFGGGNVPYSRYLLHDYMTHATGDIYTDKQVRLMVENVEREVVGMIDLVNFQPQHLRAEIGIVIRKEHQRKGYAETAVRAVMDYAYRVLHLHQLYAIVAESNIPACRLFSKLDFIVQIELKDWLYDGKEYQNAVVVQTFL